MELFEQLWRPSVIGGLVLGITGILGWWEAAAPHRWPVLAVEWWLTRLVDPLLDMKSWGARCAVIFLNNTLICAVLVVAGLIPHAPWLLLGLIGFGLGVAMNRLMIRDVDTQEPPDHLRFTLLLCFGLNLLEIPAILLSAGLSLVQATLTPTMPWLHAWWTWLCLSVPLLLVSAVGEAYWMGILHVSRHDQEYHDQDL